MSKKINENLSKEFRLGQVGINNQELKMTIIAYRKYIDLDVQFEDGTIVYHKAHINFKRGEVKNPFYPFVCGIGYYGADMNTSVSSKTEIFIYGTKPGPSKVEKVESLVSNGFNIMLLSEDEFYQALDDIEKKSKSLDGIFSTIDNVTDAVSVVSDKLVDGIAAIVGKILSFRKKKKVEEDEYE